MEYCANVIPVPVPVIFLKEASNRNRTISRPTYRAEVLRMIVKKYF